jgi:two-component system nitrogen regulation response regulator GlnG
LLQMARLLLTPQPTDGHDASGNPDHHLEHYFESKLADFVKGMKHGSASDLHPMLIKTVERPLISHALKVTNGNQIKTAHLLGMNRNTLRKKITDLRISVHREKPRRARTGVSV